MSIWNKMGPAIGGGLGGTFGGVYGAAPGAKYGQGLQDQYGGGDGGGWYGGMPSPEGYLAPDPKSLYLSDNLNREGLDAFRKEALRQDLSRGSRIAIGQNDKDTLAARSNAKSGAQGAAAMARSQLAMKGGLMSGAAERVGKSAADSAVNAAQNAEAMGSRNKASIAMDDEKMRMANLSQLPGMDMGVANYEKGINEGNSNRYLAEVGRRNAWNQNTYNQNMSAWAAGKQAQATAESGKK